MSYIEFQQSIEREFPFIKKEGIQWICGNDIGKPLSFQTILQNIYQTPCCLFFQDHWNIETPFSVKNMLEPLFPYTNPTYATYFENYTDDNFYAPCVFKTTHCKTLIPFLNNNSSHTSMNDIIKEWIDIYEFKNNTERIYTCKNIEQIWIDDFATKHGIELKNDGQGQGQDNQNNQDDQDAQLRDNE